MSPWIPMMAIIPRTGRGAEATRAQAIRSVLRRPRSVPDVARGHGNCEGLPSPAHPSECTRVVSLCQQFVCLGADRFVTLACGALHTVDVDEVDGAVTL